ncbi:MAG: serine/threonine-protein phosphatase [Desulfobacteraceae bacterium]|nr:serine/threonine-protein phosphatase [Desulfobacteraceae bacterium]MBC2755542.1 serine/threonine-protein phosphatase [Desulfobacteraceae bacterium]
MKYTVFSAMLLGPRSKQEDCIIDGIDLFQSNQLNEKKIIDTDFLLLGVCDGMGGHDQGETASRFVCEQIKNKFNRTMFSAEKVKTLLTEIQNSAQKHLPENCGTTVAGLMIMDGQTIVFNAGDSRVYKISTSGMDYISHDHSLVQGLVDKSFIQKDTAPYHPLKNIIDFGIGPLFNDVWENFDIHIFEESISRDAWYLLCSDGVNDLMNEKEIHELLMPSPIENGTILLQALQKKELKDNTSFIILQAN